MINEFRFWSRLRVRAILPYVLAAVVVVVAIAILGREIHEHLQAMEHWIAGLGVWGPIAFVALVVVVTSLLGPDTVLAIAAGALFGIFVGGSVMVAGALLAAMVQYGLACRLVQQPIERVLARRTGLRAIVEAVSRREVRMQVLLRLTPLSPPVVNYLMGAAGVRFGGFMLACLVMIPSLFVEAYFGYASVHVASLAGRTGRQVELRDGLIVGGVVVLIAVMVLISRAARLAIQEAAAVGDPVAKP